MKKFVKIMMLSILVISMIMPSFAAVPLNDISGHWAAKDIEKWFNEGMVSGYQGDVFKPNSYITRAEFFTLIYNVIGQSTADEVPFSDVAKTDWFAEACEFAYAAGITSGYPDGTFRPMNQITREEVAVVIEQLLKLAPTNQLEKLKAFSDFEDSDQWNQSALESLLAKGILKGYTDETLRPNNNITRAEAIALLEKVFGERYSKSGTYGGENKDQMAIIEGNLTINAGEVTLKNMIVKGDVYVSEKVGEGEVHLDNVTIQGNTIIKGGGENSIYFNDVTVNGALVVRKANNKIRIVASGTTKVSITKVESGAILLEQELEGGGFEAVEIPANVIDLSEIILDGDFESVSVSSPNIQVEVAKGTSITKLVATEAAANLTIKGEGVIADAEINSINTTINATVTKVTAKEGVNVIVNNVKPTVPTTGEESTNQEMWTLVWQDEFNGTEIDPTKWQHEIGNWIIDGSGNAVAAGWGNNEKEYYTDSSENAYLENGKLVIKALKETTTDAYGTYDYTSAKLLTKGLFDQKYGKYEIRAKLPVGNGLWPAIWMLPADDVYGGWAASGELDIAEGWGSKPDTVAGTLHYGGLWPKNKFSGKSYVFDASTSVNEFHNYGIEWEPGEIRWYVDGVLYQTQNNWSTQDGNGEKYAFPAPFDQEFYMILNLAVGGNFDGDPTDETVFPSTMEVDYVRVYELTGRNYMTPVEPDASYEALPEGAKVPDSEGNLISNGDFAEPIQENALAQIDFSDKWNFVQLPDFGGAASQSIDTINNTNYAKVDITNGGNQSYSVQLIQLTTLGKGRYYEVSFDAKAAANRSINMKMSAGESRGWTTYSDSYAIDITDTMATYTKTFQMTAESDIAARLEFNLGLNTNSVWIGNVKVREVPAPTVDFDASKTPLSDGNGIYNGAFDKVSLDRLAYWHFNTSSSSSYVNVPENSRMLHANLGADSLDATSAVLSQKGIQLEENTDYKLTFKAKADQARNIEIGFSNTAGNLYSNLETISLTQEMTSYTVDFRMNQASDLNAVMFINLGGTDVDVYLDDFVLKATSVDYSSIDCFPLQNGDFSAGLTDWNNYVHFDADATITEENGQAKISINGVGAETWGIQFYQGAFDFSNKVTYKLAFDVKSDLTRNLEVILDNASYYRYLSETVQASSEYTHYEYTLKLPVDDSVSLKFLLGKTDGTVTMDPHTIYIDNVVCEVKDAPKDANLLIKNGTFDSNADQWQIYTGDGSNGQMSVTEGKLEVNFSAYAGWEKWSTQVYQENILLEAGKTYEVKFDASATTDRNIWFEFNNLEQQIVPLTSVMDTYSYTFTAAETITNAKINFLLGTENMDGANFVPQSIYLDNISIVETTPTVPPVVTTEIVNGTFDTDTTNWQIYTGDGSNGQMSVTEGKLEVNFSAYAGWEKWSTQVYQENILLEAGKTYEVKFDASATTDRNIWFEFNNLEQQIVPLTSVMDTYSYTFTAAESITNAKINFLLGTENMDGANFVPQSIYLDNISITEVGL